MKYRGLLEVFLNVDAESEEEAKEKMVILLSKELQKKEKEFDVWEDEET